MADTCLDISKLPKPSINRPRVQDLYLTPHKVTARHPPKRLSHGPRAHPTSYAPSAAIQRRSASLERCASSPESDSGIPMLLTIQPPKSKRPRLTPDTPTKSLHAIPPRDFLMGLGRTQLPVRRPMQPNAGAPASNGVSLTKSGSGHHPPQIPRSVLVDERQIAISCAGSRH